MHHIHSLTHTHSIQLEPEQFSFTVFLFFYLFHFHFQFSLCIATFYLHTNSPENILCWHNLLLFRKMCTLCWAAYVKNVLPCSKVHITAHSLHIYCIVYYCMSCRFIFVRSFVFIENFQIINLHCIAFNPTPNTHMHNLE